MFQPLLDGFDRAVHHRRGRAKPGTMCMAHDAEPFVRGGLAVAVEKFPDPIDQDLGATARDAVEATRDQPLDHLGNGKARQTREVEDFRRRERVETERG